MEEEILKELRVFQGNPRELFYHALPYLKKGGLKEKQGILLLLAREVPPPDLVEEVLQLLLQEENFLLRNALQDLLRRWVREDLLPVFRKFFTHDPVKNRWLLEILSSLPSPDTGRFFLSFLKEGDVNLKVTVLDFFREFPDPVYREDFLKGFLQEKDPFVQFSYLELFSRFLQITPSLWEWIEPYLPLEPSPILLPPCLSILTFFPPERQRYFLLSWLRSTHRLEEFARYLSKVPEKDLPSLLSPLPEGILSPHELFPLLKSTDERVRKGTLVLALFTPDPWEVFSRLDPFPVPPPFPLLFWISTLSPSVEERIKNSLHDEKIHWFLLLLIGEKNLFSLRSFVKELGEKREDLYPYFGRYSGRLGIKDHFFYLKKWFFALKEGEFPFFLAGLRDWISLDRDMVLSFFRPLSETLEDPEMWVNLLRVVDGGNLVELKDLVVRAWHRAPKVVRKSALKILGSLFFEGAPYYIGIASFDPDPEVRLFALKLLSAREDCKESILPFLHDPDPYIRASALTVLVRFPDRSLVSILEKELENEFPIVRLTAFRLLSYLSPTPKTSWIKKGLKDPSEDVLVEVLEILLSKEITPPEEVRTLITHPSWRVRYKAIYLLKREGKLPPSDREFLLHREKAHEVRELLLS
jgi:hypothetical protein